jgi:hypothetical protein
MYKNLFPNTLHMFPIEQNDNILYFYTRREWGHTQYQPLALFYNYIPGNFIDLLINACIWR